MDEIKKALKENGCKLTAVRQKIVEVLALATSPMSAREIKTAARSVDLASVYRNLGLLAGLGLVHAERIGAEEKYCLALEPHHHIVCERCGYTESIACGHEYSHKNFINIKHQLILRGVCRNCQ